MSKELKKVYTESQKLFLLAMSDPQNGGDIRKCMNLAGYSNTTAQSVVVNALSEEIVELANKMIATSAVKAAGAIIGLLDDPDSLGAKNKLAAAESILNRAGVNKKSDDITIKTGGGLIILPAKNVNLDGLDAITINNE